jgi:hypothetical protein
MPGVALGVCAPGALAQVEGEATWLWSVTTQNGDAIVEPGETAMVTLAVDMDPDADRDGPVLGLAGVIFDTLGDPNAGKGQILGWEFHNGLDHLTGDTTTTDGVSLFGSTAAQLPLLDLLHFDPIDVMTFEWAPVDDGAYVVAYTSSTASVLTMAPCYAGIYTGNQDDVDAMDWPIREAMISFEVIPAPASALALAGSALRLGVRRRRCVCSAKASKIRGPAEG